MSDRGDDDGDGKSDLIDLDLDLVHETDKAILVTDGTRKAWLPRSRIEIERKGRVALVVTMPERLAIEKGLV